MDASEKKTYDNTSFKESIARILLEKSKLADNSIIKDLLFSAHEGFTSGANTFFNEVLGKTSNEELKKNLQLYPLVQAMLGVIKYYDLNKNTGIIRDTLNYLLDELDKNEKS